MVGQESRAARAVEIEDEESRWVVRYRPARRMGWAEEHEMHREDEDVGMLGRPVQSGV